MFINCPHCAALVATDPATDLAPARCPRCAVVLRDTPPEPVADESRVPLAGDAGAHAEAARDAESAASPETDAAGADDRAAPEALRPASTDVVENETSPRALDTDGSDVSREDVATIETAGQHAERPATTPEVEAPAPAQAARSPRSPAPADPVVGTADAPALVGDVRADVDASADAAPHPHAVTPPLNPSENDAATPSAAPLPHRDKAAPSFARTRAPIVAADGRRRWLLPSLIAGLSLLLALQWILADRARLAADAGWRPFVTQLCATLRCALPPWREPSAFALLERDVRPHPGVAGVLRVTATFRNDARWPQPWPRLVLTLSDVDGRAVGTRTFDAVEYLGGAPTQNALSSGQTATIRMDVVEPMPRSVAFAFDFR